MLNLLVLKTLLSQRISRLPYYFVVCIDSSPRRSIELQQNEGKDKLFLWAVNIQPLNTNSPSNSVCYDYEKKIPSEQVIYTSSEASYIACYKRYD